MSTINGKVCVVDGVAVDKVFSNGKLVYGRNLLTGTSSDLIVDASSNADPSPDFVFKRVYSGLIAGSVYTFSSDVSILGTATSISVKAFNPATWNTTSGSYTTVPIIDGKISGLVKPTDGYTVLVIYAGSAGDTHGNKVTLNHMKLEKGSVATPWTPAPEDVLKGDITAPKNLVGSQSYIK